jgi:uncharacterized protein YggU (UPF0235/DUF167 family)
VSDSHPRPWHVVADGLIVAVRLTPKGGRDALEGIERLADGSSVLKARVRAIPHEGAANEALTALVAKALKVAPGRVRLTAGATNRVKTLKIEGDGAALAAALEALQERTAA